jgi:hypothetical protein
LLLKVIAVAALAVAIAVAVLVFTMPRQSEPGAPNVKFTEFTPDRMDIKVGESTKIVFNVQNLEERSINGSKVLVVIEPSGYQPYLSISDPAVELPLLQGKDARTGQMQVVITATSAPAKEAVYTVKGVLLVDGKQTDVRNFDLKIRQQ